MNRRFVCVTASTFLAVTALAAGILQTAEGRGRASSPDGRRSNFQFSVRKLTDGPQNRKTGTAHFEVTGRSIVDVVRIEMRELRDLRVDGQAARFEGPGSIRLQRQGGPVERNGTVTVSLRDARRIGGNRDKISLQFQSSPSDVSYTFEGTVTEGDVAVNKRQDR